MSTFQSGYAGTYPRIMPTSNYIGAAGELMVTYCNGQQCLVMHDGVTPGGCWKVCANGCAPAYAGHSHSGQIICTPPTEVKCWSTDPIAGTNDSELVVEFMDGSVWRIKLVYNEVVTNAVWNRATGILTVTFSNGLTQLFDFCDEYARLSASGDKIIFPDGRVWEHCCADTRAGTCGTSYPVSPAIGAFHFNGGNTGCLEYWAGSNWLRVKEVKVGDKFVSTTTGREYTATADDACSWEQTTDSVCLLPAAPDEYTVTNTKLAVERCIGDPNNCATPFEGQKAMTLEELGFKIADTVLSKACLSAPKVLQGCGSNEQLVIREKDGQPGCYEIGILSVAAKQSYIASSGRGDVNQPLNQSFIWPDDFGPAYNMQSLQNADTNNGADPGGTGVVDEAIIVNNIVANVNFNLQCPSRFEINVRSLISTGNDVNAAFLARTSMTYRYRVDGGNWVYIRSNIGGFINTIATIDTFNGILPNISRSFTLNIPAGNIDFQLLAAVPGPSSSPAKLIISTYEPGTNITSTPSATLTPVLG